MPNLTWSSDRSGRTALAARDSGAGTLDLEIYRHGRVSRGHALPGDRLCRENEPARSRGSYPEITAGRCR